MMKMLDIQRQKHLQLDNLSLGYAMVTRLGFVLLPTLYLLKWFWEFYQLYV